ncbi:ABC transporter ATP-binding protein [Pedobacter nyackensis]|uniref:ABC transporter ATP-binding protein n=1 Tax=Pedobacter nyackensis TaxID=475255 RepID=UPI00292E1EC2|nr:ABC transporter ATP-binding protein [Pedobacter nyackensis]
MNSLKKLIKKHFSNFVFFYQYLHNRIFIALTLSIIVTVLDGLGLSMFLPLLQTVEHKGQINSEVLGNLSFLVDGIQAMGIELTTGFVLLFMLIFFICKGIAYYFTSAYIVTLLQAFIKKIRLRLLNALNKMSFKSFITSDAGRIQNTMSGEVDSVAKAYSSYFGAIQEGIMVIVYISFAFFVDAQFAVLVTAGGMIISISYKFIYNRTKSASKELTSSNNSYQGLIIQHIGNFKYLKATGRIQRYAEKLKRTIDEIEFSRKRIGILGAIGSSAREPLLVAVIAGVILIQTEIFGGTMATILVSLLFFYRALTALIHTQGHWNAFLGNSGSLENMQDFIENIESNKEKNGSIKFEKFERSIHVNNVDFAYGDTKILRNIQLTIPKYQSIAFVGESGSGKTTLVNLIAGLLPENKGEISVDGITFKELDKNTYQNRIGYITQDPVIFNDNIYNNITFWAEQTPENLERFERTIQQASLSKFMHKLPDGKETELGNNGINLSGGQKQRISIARELYKDIDILIMDEATSALDSETEIVIRQSIESLQGKYTILIVAHRLSTIRNVDRIIYLNEGTIECEGNFDELAEKHEIFRKNVDLQGR